VSRVLPSAGFKKRCRDRLKRLSSPPGVAFFWNWRGGSPRPSAVASHPAGLRGCGCRSRAVRRMTLGRRRDRKCTCTRSPESVADLAAAPVAFLPNTSFAVIHYSGAWNAGLFTYSGTVLADGSRVTVSAHEWEIDYDLVSAAGLANFTADYLPSGRFVAFRAIPGPTTCFIALTGLACGGFSMWRRRKPGRPRGVVESPTDAFNVWRLSQTWDLPQRRPEPTRRGARACRPARADRAPWQRWPSPVRPPGACRSTGRSPSGPRR
jgi:hypothetical protein